MFFCNSEFRAHALIRQTIPLKNVFNAFILPYNCSILMYIEHFSQDRHSLLVLDIFELTIFEATLRMGTNSSCSLKKVVVVRIFLRYLFSIIFALLSLVFVLKFYFLLVIIFVTVCVEIDIDGRVGCLKIRAA